MIYELLYTSVPKGLKPGAKGYCTVLTTEGIPSALLERLESYCGYRHLFDPGSPDNPVAYGHRVLNLAGNTWHILSKVADAGTDYSGRSNLIGHFMAISQDELKGISAGPTSLMMSPGLFRKELVGEPRRVSEAETSKRLVGVMDRPQKAVTWNMVAGDAGWAGKLVQTTEESSESVSLVYPLRTNTLKLLDEAASILPKNKQWDITFNTFFTKSGEECRWRCYCANVPEAVPFKGSEFDLVDVKRKGLDPGDGVYVGAAREGKKMTGGVAKAGPAIARNPLSGPRRSLIKEARAVQQAEEKEKDDWVEELGIETPKGKVRDSLRPASSKTAVPPEIGKTNRITFDEMYEDSQELRSLPKHKKQDNLLVYGLVGIIGVMMIMIAMMVFLPIISKSVRRNENLVSTNKKNQDNESNGFDLQNSKNKEESNKNQLPTDNNGRMDPVLTKPVAPNPVTAAVPPVAPNPVTAAVPPVAPNPVTAASTSAAKVLVQKPDINSNECTVLFDNTLIIPLDKYLMDKFEDENEMIRLQKDGVIIELPVAFPLKGDMAIYDNFSPEKKNVISKVEILEGLKTMRIALPKELKEGSIYNVCLATAMRNYDKSRKMVQFFTPMKIEINELEVVKNDSIRKQRTKSDLDIKNARFTFRISADNNSNKQKYELIRAIQEGRFTDKDINTNMSFITEDNELYKMLNNDTAEMKGLITKLERSKRTYNTMPMVFVGMPGKFSDRMDRMFSIENYRLFVPLSFDNFSIPNPKGVKYRFIGDDVFPCSRESACNIIDAKIKGWAAIGDHDLFTELLNYFEIPVTDRESQCQKYIELQTKCYNKIKGYIMDGDSGEPTLLGPPGFVVKIDLNKDKQHLDRSKLKINMDSDMPSIVVGVYVREKK